MTRIYALTGHGEIELFPDARSTLRRLLELYEEGEAITVRSWVQFNDGGEWHERQDV